MSTSLESKIATKHAKIGILGLGYVGLSLMEVFGKAGFCVLGYDRNKHKIDALHEGRAYLSGVHIKHLFSLLTSGSCRISHEHTILQEADVFIITVPTSLDAHRLPDLSKMRSAAHIVMTYLKKECLVILQSTSFPGTTQEELLPILHQSHLKEGIDFHLAFIPEISDFGNVQFDFAQIPKVVGGLTPTCGERAKQLYQHITKDVTLCSSPKVAEAAKILQNTYRLINISLVNEMKIMFDRMGIDIWEVIEAASKKPFGYVPFVPGPGIGGDCIPVDPYYLVWKARETKGPTSLIELAGEVNAHMPEYVVTKVVSALSQDQKAISNAKVLILGAAFKKDINDIRETPALPIIAGLQEKGAIVSYHDPYVKELTPSSRYPHIRLFAVEWEKSKVKDFDCVVVITDHSFYNWKEIAQNAKRIVDTRNVMAPYKESKIKITKA